MTRRIPTPSLILSLFIALAVLLKRMNKAEISVAVDGSLYEHHPNYHHHMMTIINKLLPGVKVSFTLYTHMYTFCMGFTEFKQSIDYPEEIYVLRQH